MVLRMRMLLSASGLLLLAALLGAPAAVVTLPAGPATVGDLANLNVGNAELLSVATHVGNAVGDKLDFNGDHFFGRDQEQHDFNRQAHQTLEYVRSQDPQLRRFLGKSIVKRQADFPYPPPVYPPTHYEPPPTTTTTTTTTTTPEPTTTTTTTPVPTTTTTTTTTEPPPPPPPPPGIPHEVYGVPPSAGEAPQDVGPGCSDCVFSQLPPLPDLFPPQPAPVPPAAPVNPDTPLVVVVPEPNQESLYNLNEVVGELVPFEPPANGAGSCTDCNFEQLPELPQLVYPSLPEPAPTTPSPTPPPPPPEYTVGLPPPSSCLPAEHRVRGETESDLIDLRLFDGQTGSKHEPRVLSPHSQVFLVQSMAPYPVLKTKPGVVQRGSLKFKHSLQEQKRNDDSVVVPAANQPGQVSQTVVLCTVDCRTLEENVPPPETPALTIPNDGRLW